jgi:HEAT repeat protein
MAAFRFFLALSLILWATPAWSMQGRAPAYRLPERHYNGLTESQWIRLAEDRKSPRRLEAIDALGCMNSKQGISTLLRALKDKSRETRLRAAYALGQYELAWVQVVPPLLEIGAPAVPALVEIAKGPNPNSRRAAIIALGKIGPNAESARPVLTSLLEDADIETRMSAAEALNKIGQKTGR